MIEKLTMESPDLSQEHIKEIQKLFPDVVTEEQVDGQTRLGIDFDKLKQELSSSLIGDGKERYQLTWPGKMDAIRLANTPTTATLRPLPEKSVDFDNTQNVYIEGDNLEVLKVMRETYLNKIKMIYIDPPYNTGNDFLFSDDFSKSKEVYSKSTDQFDEEGNRMVPNLESNGKYHTDWLNMIYPRLKVARDLLTEDGVMFISIDDHELDNLLKIAREVFSDKNVDVMVWRKSGVGRDGKMKNTSTFRKDHEYIVVCYKAIAELNKSFVKPSFVNSYSNLDEDPRGPYEPGSISRTEEASNAKSKNFYSVISPTGRVFTRQFDISKDEFDKLNNDCVFNANGKKVSRIYWGKNGDSCPRIKIFVNEKRSVTTSSFLEFPLNSFSSDVIDDSNATTTKGSKELDALLNADGLGNEMRPKPSDLIKRLIQIGTKKDSIVLDFFSGSGTTGQSVVELNCEDKGQRKFVLIQIPEKCEEGTIGYKLGFKNICELGEARIKKNSVYKNSDFGFRVFKIDSSNMQDDFYSPKETTKSLIDTTIDNIKPDRTDMDLLIQVMLNLGLLLSSKFEKKMIGNKTVYLVNGNDLIACFDSGLTNDEIKQIAQLQPVYAAFRDSCFASDSVGINNEQIFKTISPATTIKVL